MSNLVQNGTRIESSVSDQYRIMQFLGAGGNCQVYLAMATKGNWQGVLFAIKFFMRSDDSDRLAQFNREKEFLLKTNHPAIMKIYSEGNYFFPSEKKNIPFVICDYFPDRLDHRLFDRRLRLTEKLIYILQLLSALQYLESLAIPIVHRDIKPQNIFLKGYSCALGDFGLMRDLDPSLVNEDGEFLKRSEGPGMPKFYRSPDLVRYAKGEASLTTASDTFQLGLVAAEMFTGRNPLKKSQNKLDEIVLEDLNDISGQSGDLIRDLIEQMLVLDPQHRGKLNHLLDGFDGVLRTATTKQIEIDGFTF